MTTLTTVIEQVILSKQNPDTRVVNVGGTFLEGVTVSETEPENPSVGALWVDIS